MGTLSRCCCSFQLQLNQRLPGLLPFQAIGFRSLYRGTEQFRASRRHQSPAAYISLGSNLGGTKRIRTIENAISRIRSELGAIDSCSCLYESLPGYDVDPRSKQQHDMYMPLHLNAVVRVLTSSADPQAILDVLQRIEAEHGRDRSPTGTRLHRTLDLDLLLFEDANSESVKLDTEMLKLPHPRLAKRNFVLFPLCDIDPNLVHPSEGVTMSDLLQMNLKRRREVLLNSPHNASRKLQGDAGEDIPTYTLDGNLAVPRRCFAPNDNQLWTVKASGPAVGDTLRWIREVLRRQTFDKSSNANFTVPPSVESLRALERSLTEEPRTPRIMGVLNVTPDSFSDGSRYNANVETALRHACDMVEEGAEIIDVGGEATNPFVKDEVPAEVEMGRVSPIIDAIRKHVGAETIVSVDTRRTPVAGAAAACGADMINDVTAGDSDPNLFNFVASRRLPIVIMHSRGAPWTMNKMANYDDVVEEVARYLTAKATSLMQQGLPRWRLVFDPGLGFAKTPEQSYEILRRLTELQARLPSGIPLLLGHSRKRFIGSAIKKCSSIQRKTEQGAPEKDREIAARDVAGLAVVCWSAVTNCVDILRVHDVKKTVLACSVMKKIMGSMPVIEPDIDFYSMFPAAARKPPTPINSKL